MYNMASSIADLVSGHGRYVDDVQPEGTLHAAFVRSSLAHASVDDIELPMVGPGAVVHTADSLQAPDISLQARPRAPSVVMDRPTLARDRVRYVGEPVALTLAPTKPQAVDLADEVWVDLSPLPHVVDPIAAATDSLLLFPGAGTNIVKRSHRGAGDSPLPDAPVVVDVTVSQPRLAGVSIEPLACLAIPRADHIEVWCGSQQPHRLCRYLSRVFGLEESFFRIIVPDVGGGFGIKGPIYPEYVAVIAAALRHERPVLWREMRREAFVSGVHGRGLLHRVQLAGDRGGSLVGARIEIIGNVGAYPHSGYIVAETAASIGTGPYRIEDLGVVATSVVTNLAPTGPYRGAGRPEAAMAIERAIETYARRINRDPVEVRLKNMLTPDQLPHVTPIGTTFDSGDYPLALRTASDRLGAESFRTRQERRRTEGGNPIGIGFAAFVEPSGGAVDAGEYVSVEIIGDGSILVRTGSTAAGQRHDEVWKQVVGQAFGVGPDRVSVISGDTHEVADGEGTYGSRSVQITASGLTLCSGRLIDRLRNLAAEMLEASSHDLVLTDGRFEVAGSPDAGVSLARIVGFARERGVDLSEAEVHRLETQTFSYGTHAAEVEVDVETGEVRVVKLVAVDDAGVVLDPEGAEGQVRGGIAQGLGQALFEAIEYDDQGQLMTASLMGYQVPHASDIPPVELVQLETPALVGLGAKGVGESGVIGVPVAILHAVLDALEPLGIEDLPFPLTSRAVWTALHAARAETGQPQTT